MHPFELYLPTRLIFGKDSIKRLPDVLSGHTNILLTYGGGSIKRSGIYDKVKGLLSDKHICELSGIAPNPKVQSARDGVGSVLDLSKLISAAISYEGDPWELVLDPSKITKTPVPLFDVLTLTATGSEYDNSGVISNPDTDEKMPIFGNLNPVASILDPTYTFTVNAWQTASGSADIMSHTFESYLVAEGTTLTDGLCEAMLRTVIKNTPIAIKHPDDYDARAELMQAASFGCCGILADGMTPSPWVCHGIEHEISAFHDITHRHHPWRGPCRDHPALDALLAHPQDRRALQAVRRERLGTGQGRRSDGGGRAGHRQDRGVLQVDRAAVEALGDGRHRRALRADGRPRPQDLVWRLQDRNKAAWPRGHHRDPQGIALIQEKTELLKTRLPQTAAAFFDLGLGAFEVWILALQILDAPGGVGDKTLREAMPDDPHHCRLMRMAWRKAAP